VKYEEGFYIPEDDILHSHRSGNLKSYIAEVNFQLPLYLHIELLKHRRNLCHGRYNQDLHQPNKTCLAGASEGVMKHAVNSILRSDYTGMKAFSEEGSLNVVTASMPFKCLKRKHNFVNVTNKILLWSEFLATDAEVPGSISGAPKFSESASCG
jgi:hypothetical protein